MNKGCGASLCCGHGHYEICGKPGQMGIYICDGCKLEAAKKEAFIAGYCADTNYICNYEDEARTDGLRAYQEWVESEQG